MTANDTQTSLASRLHAWLQGAAGQALLQTEQRRVAGLLADLFGYHIVQLGLPQSQNFIATSRIGHKLIVAADTAETATAESATGLISAAEALPLQADSIDVLVLAHVLEFTDDPHQLLREVERVLIGEGHVVIIGFNPWSLWGISRALLGWREEPPWCGHFFSALRIQDWLHLLGFQIMHTEKLFYRPPLRNDKLLARLAFMDKLGRYAWPWWGGAHVILAKKRVVQLLPMREVWRHRRHKIATGVVEPTVRQ
ncbi:MAG: methyltransferase domain-containing protein [Gammaproteobacteria bacterium]